MSDIHGRKVTISDNGKGFGSVVVDGIDISNGVHGATLHINAGQVPALTLDLLIHEEARLDAGDAAVFVPEPTREALIALGWTPPTT